MNTRIFSRRPTVAIALLGVVLIAAAPAYAGLGKHLVRGITYSLSPNIGTVQNGPNLNQNVFSQRFSQNPIVGGGSYENTRIFGADTYGNSDTLNLGLLNVQLGSPTGSPLQGAGIYNKVGYTTLLMPSVNFTSRSTGRNLTNLGTTATAAAPIQYSVQGNDGIEQYTLAGTLAYDASGSVNALGFYNVQLNATNTGTLKASGVADNRTQDTSFDLGPVNLSGNIFVDAILGGLKSAAQQAGLPTDLLASGPAAKLRSPDEIAKAIAGGQSVTAPELESLLAAHLQDPTGVGLPNSGNSAAALSNPSASGTTPVPEPGTVALLLVGACGLFSRLSRRR